MYPYWWSTATAGSTLSMPFPPAGRHNDDSRRNDTPLGCIGPPAGCFFPEPVDVGAGGGELVLQVQDGFRRGERVPVVEKSARAGGLAELCAGVPPMAAGGAVRGQDAGAVQAAQEGGLDAEQLRGL